MSTTHLRRHHRRAFDHVLHLAYSCFEERKARKAFTALVAVVRARSRLLEAAPRLARGQPRFDALDALVNLARFWREHRADIESWPGVPERLDGDEPAHAHPRAVIDSLQRHLFGLYATPRFLAQVWEQADADERSAEAPLDRASLDAADEWRGWVLAHGRGTAWRKLPLPIALTRAMERAFLASPEHLPLPHALRRAEVLGLGGSVELADAIAQSRLGKGFEHGEYWRAALAWMARQGDELRLEKLGVLLDYLETARGWSKLPPVEGRTVASLERRAREWNRVVCWGGGSAHWPAAAWTGREERAELPDQRVACWYLFQLRDVTALQAEGKAMRHCVGSYSYQCTRGVSTIWTLRRRVERAGQEVTRMRSVFTLEIDPRTRTLVQVKGFANRKPGGPGVAIVQRWVAEQGLRVSTTLAKQLVE